MRVSGSAAIICAVAISTWHVLNEEAKKAAVAEAVKIALDTNNQDLAAEALRSLPSDEAWREVASDFLPITPETADKYG
jgi:hypothetical protein